MLGNRELLGEKIIGNKRGGEGEQVRGNEGEKESRLTPFDEAGN